jgi:hypothetical protein
MFQWLLNSYCWEVSLTGCTTVCLSIPHRSFLQLFPFFLPVMNKLLWAFLCKFLDDQIFSFFRCICRCRIAALCDKCMFNFIRNCQIVLQCLEIFFLPAILMNTSYCYLKSLFRAGSMAQVGECIPSKLKPWVQIPLSPKPKQNKSHLSHDIRYIVAYKEGGILACVYLPSLCLCWWCVQMPLYQRCCPIYLC